MPRLAISCLALLALAACSGEAASPPPPPEAPHFIGVYSAARGTGTLSITLPPDAVPPVAYGYDSGAVPTPLPISGALRVAGEGALPLTGTIYASPGTVYLRGGVYALYGYAEAGDSWGAGPTFVSIEGPIFSPLGGALFTALLGTEADVRRWCGAFSGTAAGNWTLIQAQGGPLKAMAVSTDATITARLDGSILNSAIALTEEPSSRVAGLSATGGASASGDSLFGTWTLTDGRSGRWGASARACR